MKRVNYLIVEKPNGQVGVLLSTADVDSAYDELDEIRGDSSYGASKVVPGYQSLNTSEIVADANSHSDPLSALESAIRNLNEFGF